MFVYLCTIQTSRIYQGFMYRIINTHKTMKPPFCMGPLWINFSTEFDLAICCLSTSQLTQTIRLVTQSLTHSCKLMYVFIHSVPWLVSSVQNLYPMSLLLEMSQITCIQAGTKIGGVYAMIAIHLVKWTSTKLFNDLLGYCQGTTRPLQTSQQRGIISALILVATIKKSININSAIMVMIYLLFIRQNEVYPQIKVTLS